MHANDFSLLEKMNIKSDVVFASQCDHTSYEEKQFGEHTAKMISTQTRGVGKNRNLGLIYASGDICMFADDDVRYDDDAAERVIAEFEAHPDADVMMFNFDTNNPIREEEHHTQTKKWRSVRNPWGTFQIAFRLSSVRKANVWFTTLLGGGCTFPCGEDSMWLNRARKAGLTFYVSKETLGKVTHETSTWFTGYDEKYYYGAGACYQAVDSKLALLKSLIRVLRDRGRGNLSGKQKFQWLTNGRNGYQNMLSYQDFINTMSSPKG
jgi:glycosyltransferase involved in cell wall biosynthesis